MMNFEIEDEHLKEVKPNIIGDKDICGACGADLDDRIYVLESKSMNSWLPVCDEECKESIPHLYDRTVDSLKEVVVEEDLEELERELPSSVYRRLFEEDNYEEDEDDDDDEMFELSDFNEGDST